MSYAPHPKSIAAKIIKWMQLQDKSMEFSTTVIADALGIEGGNIAGSLQAAVAHGVVVKETRPNPEGMRLTFWKLGDGTPAALPEDYEPDEPLSRPVTLTELLRQKLSSQSEKVQPATPVEPPQKRKVVVIKRQEQQPKGQPVENLQPQFLAGLTADDQLLLKKGDVAVMFNAAQMHLIYTVLRARLG